jgi:1-acyl-sn-glycerol-3-phosphate acyltransferase
VQWVKDFLRKQILNKFVIGTTHIRLEGVENIPQNEPLIIATNHIHWWDMLITIPYLLNSLNLLNSKPYTLSAKPLKMLHLISTLFVNPIYLSRDGGEHDNLMIETCINHIKNGYSIILSPEGRRNKNQLIQAKTGVAFIATYSKASILPVAIYKQKSDSNWFGFKKSTWIIKIGEKINNYQGDIDSMQLTNLTTRVMQEIATLLPDKMKGIYNGNHFVKK